MNKLVLSLSLLFSLLLTRYCYADNQVPFDTNSQIQITAKEKEEIKDRFNSDMNKGLQAKKINDERDKVIEECGKLFDNNYSDESLAKVKSCLSSNGGNFPADQQISIDNSQPIPQQKIQPVQQTLPVQQQNTTSINSTKQITQSPSKTNTQSSSSKKEGVSDLMQSILR